MSALRFAAGLSLFLSACGAVEREDADGDSDSDSDTGAGVCDAACAHAVDCDWAGAAECDAECGCFTDVLLGDDAVDPYMGCLADLDCADQAAAERTCGEAAATVIGGSANGTYRDECEAWACDALPCALYSTFTEATIDPLFDCLHDETDCAGVESCTDAILAALCSS